MARDFRPKDKKAKPQQSQQAKPRTFSGSGSGAPAPAPAPRQRDFRPKDAAAPAAAAAPSTSRIPQKQTFAEDDDGDEGDDGDDDGDDGEEGTEDQLRQAIAALGGEEDDLDLISGKALKAKKGKAKGTKGADDAAEDPNLGSELRAFMKGLNFETADVPPPPPLAPANGKDADESKKDKKAEKAEKKKAEKADKKKAREEAQAQDQTPTDSSDPAPKSKAEKKKEKAAKAEAEKAAALANKQRDQKLGEIASKAAKTASAAAAYTRKPGQLLLEPVPQWMEVSLEPLPAAASSSSSSPVVPSHDEILSLLAHGNTLLEADNAAYHATLNSGSAAKMSSLGGLTPSDAKFIASLLGDTTSTAGSGGSGGTLSDRIAAHALLLGSSPFHNLRSLDALLGMAAKKSREESGRATRALADWFAGAGLGTGRKLRYFRDQPELPSTAVIAASDSVAKQQRLAFFAFEDRLKKSYFSFLQTLESQSHDTLAFVRQQAVTQVYILLKEKSEQEQNLLRLLVNKLGDGERSVASKAMNSLLELLNAHPAMKGIVAREVGELIRKPTRSSSRVDAESTKRHHNHAKYYGVLTLNQIILTRQDTAVANALIQLYFELFEEGLNEQSSKPEGGEGDAEGEGEAGAPAKKDKQRWRDNKGKGGKKGKGKGKGKNDKGPAGTPSIVQDAEGKMMAAVLTGVRRAFPFVQLDVGLFDRHLNTLFKITHAASFNIAIQALQLIHVVATSSSSSTSGLLDRFHSTLYSSMLDPRLRTTSKTAMYLNLCFKAMRDDVDDARRAAQLKRLVQLLSHMDVEFVCGALYLVAELVRAHPKLRGMLTDPEDDDEERILDPPDEESESDEAQGAEKKRQPAAPSAGASGSLIPTGYDPSKRDPRYARASSTCLWELTPLLAHFHPTVRLLASQLLSRTPLSTKPDLSLYSLSHFLDRFVYRNPKKASASSAAGAGAKGASGMQPAVALAASASSNGLVHEEGVRKVKGWGHAAAGAEGEGTEVNTEKFWRKKAEDVPVDALFFHRYFNLREARDSSAKKGKARRADTESGSDEDGDEDEDAASLASDEVDAALRAEAEAGAGDSDDDEDDSDDDADASDTDTDDSEEREIWAAMKRSMPAEEGDEDLMLDSGADEDDDEDLEMYNYTDSEDEQEAEEEEEGGKKPKKGKKSAPSEEDEDEDEEDDDDDEMQALFDEDEDDLLPFAEFGSEGDSASASDSDGEGLPSGTRLRDEDDDEEDEAATGEKRKSRSQVARAERKERKKKRMAMGTFASAEDYAHLLGGSDEE